MRARSIGTAVALGLSAGLFACPRLPPLTFGPEGPIADPDVLLKMIDARTAGLRSMRASAKVRVESAAGSGSADHLLAAARPRSLRLDALDFFGRPVLAVACDGDRFTAYNAEQRLFHRGRATEGNLEPHLPVPLPPESIVALLLGEAPRIPAASRTLSVDEALRAYRVVLAAPGRTQTIHVGTVDGRIIASRIDGPSGYEVEFDDFDEVDGRAFAHRVRLRVPGRKLTVEVRFRDVELPPALEPSPFALDPPPGARIVDVDGPDAPRGEGPPGSPR